MFLRQAALYVLALNLCFLTLPSVAATGQRPAGKVLNVTQLTASDGAPGNGFGASTAMSGDTVAVGSGKVYVFVKPVGGWTTTTETAQLSASDGAFLGAVAINSDTIVATAAAESALYVFVKPQNGWINMTQTAILTSSDQAAIFGASVSVSGGTIVAGSGGSQNGAGGPAAYVYVEPAGGWSNMTQTAELTSSDGGGPLTAVAISGNTVVAGAFAAKVGSNVGQGAAYVFVEPSAGWSNSSETAKLTASDGAANDVLGSAVAVNGSTVVAGAPGAVIGGHLSAGAAYIFAKPTRGWSTMTQTAKLTASDARYKASLGSSVSVVPNEVVAGTPQEPIGATQAQGAVYTFAKPATGWANKTQTSRLTTSDGSGALGTSVAVSASTVAAGAPYVTVGVNKLQGAVYVFGSGGAGPAVL
jgi:FG-GAP repeat